MPKEPTNSQLLSFMKEQFKEVNEQVDMNRTLINDGFSGLDKFTSKLEALEHEQTSHQAAIERLEEHAGLN